MDRSGFIEASQSDDGRYRVLVEAITDYAIFMLDPEGLVTSWNSGAQRFKGYVPSEIIGQHFSRFYTDQDRAAGIPAEALRRAQAENRYETEGWRVRKDGGLFWAHVLIDPIRSPDGGLVGYAKITRDLTERRAAQESLVRSQEQFRLLVQGVTDYALYMLDLDGRVTNWNAGAERIKGYRPEEIIGQHFSRFYGEQDRAAGEPDAALRTAAAEGRFEKEGWRIRKDGSRFWAHVVIDPIRDDAGEPIGFAKITRDITERRDAQAALEVTRQALFQSQKLEAIGQLTGGIAHDFNNLLMAVLGSLELLRKRLPDDSRAEALLDNAVQGARRGAILTQRMLAFARKQDLRLEGVCVAGLVHGMAGLLERSAGPSITLTLDAPPGLGPAHTDANQLETALLNLVVNARDAMPEGGRIRVEVSEARQTRDGQSDLPPGDYVRLVVEDDGPGMDAATLARATEPFFTTKGVGKGTGLGLSMVHGLAEQSGGRLVMHSNPGGGTRAEIWLPRADAPGLPRQEPVGPVAAPASRRPLRVLAVDDDALVLTNMTAMLEDLGHLPVAAGSAGEALEALACGPVDVVITDHAMPQMTGLQLARAIASLRPELPVVLATGFAELPEGDGADLRRLSKPFGQADLARVLREAAPEAEPVRGAADGVGPTP